MDLPLGPPPGNHSSIGAFGLNHATPPTRMAKKVIATARSHAVKIAIDAHCKSGRRQGAVVSPKEGVDRRKHPTAGTIGQLEHRA